jgi:hypothetical protein
MTAFADELILSFDLLQKMAHHVLTAQRITPWRSVKDTKKKKDRRILPSQFTTKDPCV